MFGIFINAVFVILIVITLAGLVTIYFELKNYKSEYGPRYIILSSEGFILYTGVTYVVYDIVNDELLTETFLSVATAQYLFTPGYAVVGEL